MLNWEPERDTTNWNPSAIANVLTSPDELEANLKGADAALLRACRSLSLCTVVRMVYNDYHTETNVLVDKVFDYYTDFFDSDYGETFLDYLRGSSRDSKYKGYVIGKEVDVQWVTRLSYCNELQAAYQVTGKRPVFTDQATGKPCILLQVGPAGMRGSQKLSIRAR
ncbi:hypothetical protein DFH11DRAFT_1087419 [Phellopilus nigrolimitatus]|nr:hypothetical protein DFH11DRAFT_1087419 [Phellopilus nigrolimitatus]